MEHRTEVAARIAAARRARRLTQEQLAAEAMISVSLLRKIEQGSRAPADKIVESIANALDIDPATLTDSTPGTDHRIHSTIPEIRRALDAYDLPDDGPVRPLAELHQAANDAERRRLFSRYVHLAREVPPLLTELSRARHSCTDSNRPTVAALLVSALRSADAVAYKYGYHDLSARIIDLMRHAAGETGDNTLNAAVAYVRTETFFATGNLPAALRALNLASATVPPERADSAAAYGALHMRAAVVAARFGNATTARSHLREAHDIADRIPESVYHGTAFGPDSVRIHDVAVSVELGDETAAIQSADGWTPPIQLPAERRSHYFIDLARAQLWAGRRHAAFNSLRHARHIAPQHVRQHPHVHETITTLIRLQRAPSNDLLTYAHWLQPHRRRGRGGQRRCGGPHRPSTVP